MSPSVDTAADLIGQMVEVETRGNGDIEPAMRRIETKYGVDYWLLWKLKYRKPKDIWLKEWLAVVDAYRRWSVLQEARFKNARRAAEELGANKALLSLADRVAGIDTET